MLSSSSTQYVWCCPYCELHDSLISAQVQPIDTKSNHQPSMSHSIKHHKVHEMYYVSGHGHSLHQHATRLPKVPGEKIGCHLVYDQGYQELAFLALQTSRSGHLSVPNQYLVSAPHLPLAQPPTLQTLHSVRRIILNISSSRSS